MNAIAKTEPMSGEIVAGPAPDATAMLSMIERLARDPTVEVERLNGIMSLFERMDARRADQAYSEEMSAAQASMERIAADATNPQTSSKYATYAQLDRAIRPIYTRHGFSLNYGTERSDLPDHIKIVCKVRHRAGHSEMHGIDMPSDGKGAKGNDVMTKTHAVGAAFTYGQRYLLKGIFNIAVGNDDDGNSNGGRKLGAAAKRIVETLNGHKTPAEHVAWKANHAEGAEKIVEPWEWKEIVSLWNRRAASLKEAAPAQGDVSDFPGDRR